MTHIQTTNKEAPNNVWLARPKSLPAWVTAFALKSEAIEYAERQNDLENWIVEMASTDSGWCSGMRLYIK